MIQEDKDLLLKDLCARIPYYVKCNYNDIYNKHNGTLMSINNNRVTIDGICKDIADVKPYLFPLSSMTEEQKKEYNLCKHEVPTYHYEYGDIVEDVELFDSLESFEYLIKNHFDYRGLIPMGLAIDCTNLNIY